MNVGEYIKQLRLKKDITQEELGKIVGVQRAAVQKWESGQTQNLKRVTIQMLASYFNVSPATFVCENIEMESNLNKNAKQLLDNYNKLNEVGQNEAVKRVAELTEIEKYTRQDVSANDFEILPVAARSGKSGIVIPTSSKEERNTALDEEFPGTSTPTTPKKF